MSLSFTYPIYTLILATLLAGWATYWVYKDTVPALSAGRRSFLGGLRFLALFVIIFLLAEPLVRAISEQFENPILAILIDESQSVTVAESDSSRNTYAGLLTQIESATRSEQVQLFGFGGAPRRLSSVDSASSRQSRTDLSTGLDYVRTTLENEPLGAVLLVSDGRHNGGRNPEHIADLFPVPIVALTVGDSTIQKDIRVQQVLTNDISYVGSEVPVRVRIRNEGFEPVNIQVSLSSGRSPIASEMVRLPPPGSEVAVDLPFMPDSVGHFQYRIDISRLSGELTYRNNAEVFSLQILERKKRIFVLAGAPSPDVSAFRQLLTADADTDLMVRTRKNTAEGSYYEGDFPQNLSNLDLIVLIGFPSASTQPAEIGPIRAQIESGTPLLFISDRSADLASVQRHLGGLLPARPVVIRPGYVEGGFVPTDAAFRHSVFEISDRRNVQRWLALPPLVLNQSRWEVTPTANVLATTLIRGLSIDDPILVTGRRGSLRSAALLATGFWKWNNVPEDLASDAGRWKELFANLIQWLVTAEDDRLVRVAPVSRQLDEGEPVVFSGQVYDENLSPLSDVSLMLDVQYPNGEEYPFVMQSVGNGQYRVDIGSLPGGTYSYQAVASRDSGILGSDRGTLTVGELSIEFRNPSSDTRLMRQIAARSGGFTISASELSTLERRLASLASYKTTVNRIEVQNRLWRYLPFLFAIIAIVTLEWFFRKRFGLV